MRNRILVVVPEPRERAKAAVCLRALGYAPVLASSPLEGIECLVNRPGSVHGVCVARELSKTPGSVFLDFIAGEFPDVEYRWVWDDSAAVDRGPRLRALERPHVT